MLACFYYRTHGNIMTEKNVYAATEGEFNLMPSVMAELKKREHDNHIVEAGHICDKCGVEYQEGSILEYVGMWWCKDCMPNLKMCEVCGTTYDSEIDKKCPECT